MVLEQIPSAEYQQQVATLNDPSFASSPTSSPGTQNKRQQLATTRLNNLLL
jgi:hypothetical protein